MDAKARAPPCQGLPGIAAQTYRATCPGRRGNSEPRYRDSGGRYRDQRPRPQRPSLNYRDTGNHVPRIALMVGEGFEPSKAEPTGLQPVPFDRSGIPPGGGKFSDDSTWTRRPLGRVGSKSFLSGTSLTPRVRLAPDHGLRLRVEEVHALHVD